jgi:hypothetical protein
MAESSGEITNTQMISMDQVEQMFQLFQKLNKQSSSTENPSSMVKITEKLTYNNYTKWCKLMQIAVGCRGRLSHITAAPVANTEPEYPQWAQQDSTVISWIIENIDADLVNQVLDYTTAKDLWKGIETLLSSGRDELQIFDLSTNAATLVQGKDSIEVFFGKLNILWK